MSSDANSPPDDESDVPRIGILKAVTISDEPEQIAPSISKNAVDSTSPTLIGSRSPKLHRASTSGRKLGGRPPIDHSYSVQSLGRTISSLKLEPTPGQPEAATLDEGNLLSQVVNWLHEEKAKRVARKRGREPVAEQPEVVKATASKDGARPRSDSQGSEGGTALEKLERILSTFTSSISREPRSVSRRESVAKKFMKRNSISLSSDTEFQDAELVPNVEAVLDNSKTMAFCGGVADDGSIDSQAKAKDKDHWLVFKREILRLTHTLRLKGWRNVPSESSGEIDVERLSGALTNAVYVVSPPKILPDDPTSKGSSASLSLKRKPPQKLLLRVYGPQVEHLIDREIELGILKRLARKRIGPRMLGTFTNGRFEEFLHARTLTAEDLRVPDTSVQIAKRMRELHDGIELLEEERAGGPHVWAEWDKWVGRSEQVISWLDAKIQASSETIQSSTIWMNRGLVCGVEWPLFRRTVEKYRKYVDDYYGGEDSVKEHLIFAHNDTQYGNLMRLEPDGESPLLKPANEHRQLVVIDFEYANANTRAYEFANHFNEWCYNYHHPKLAWVCNTNAYPTEQEQYRFVKSYLMHRPHYYPSASSTPKTTPVRLTPKMEAMHSTFLSSFMLDSRTPGGKVVNDYDADEKEREESLEKEVQRLLREIRMWRGVNSAHWVAWGIVQATVPELDQALKAAKESAASTSETSVETANSHVVPQSDPLDAEVRALHDNLMADRPEGREQEEARKEGEVGEEAEGEDDEFDYLAYSQDRAQFFWGDCLQLGIITEEELPESLMGQIKFVKW